MRELKFRAWNTEKKKWLDMGLLVLYPSDRGGMLAYPLETNGELGAKLLNIEIIQFTGLKDKNGREIYEGDIIYEEFTGKSIILWDEGNLQYRMTEPISGSKNGFLSLGMELQVIGNIYENPKLIK